jgi:predicted transposase YdaD
MTKKKEEITTKGQENKGTKFPNVKNPHNDLFIRVFSRKDKAIAFFKKYLPAAILAMIDLDSIELVDSKHALELGINLYNDLVYKFRLKNKPGLCIIVFEHQSTIAKNMPFRFLKYDVCIIQKYLEQGYEKIPLLKNVLFYTGAKPWKKSTKFDDYYDEPENGSKYLHLEEFTLIQLPDNNDHPDYTDKDLGYCLAAFKCGREKGKAYEEFKKFKQIPGFRDYFDKLPEEERLQAAIYIGIFSSENEYELEKIVNLVATSEQEKNKFMRTIAQKYQEEGREIGIEEGREIGIEEGIEKGIEKVAQNMFFKLHFDLDTVQKATGLTKGNLQRIIKK